MKQNPEKVTMEMCLTTMTKAHYELERTNNVRKLFYGQRVQNNKLGLLSTMGSSE